jgi:hypothetical protein
MKFVIRGAIYNFLCILVFGLIYTSLHKHFTLDATMSKYIPPNILDIFFMSTTIQAGVGLTCIYPMTSLSKILMMVQQYFMILSNLLLIYFFTL